MKMLIGSHESLVLLLLLQCETKSTILITLDFYLPIQQIRQLNLAFSLKAIGDGCGNSKIYTLSAKILKQGHKRP